MIDALLTMLPIFGFMLIPVFIPLVAVAIGSIADVVDPSRRPLRVRDRQH